MPDDTVDSLRALLGAQSALLARATRKVTELERIIAANPRGPTAGQDADDQFAIVQGKGEADPEDLIWHLNARHLGSHSALLRVHANDHAFGGHAPHAHTGWSFNVSTQAPEAARPDTASGSPSTDSASLSGDGRGASAGEARRP